MKKIYFLVLFIISLNSNAQDTIMFDSDFVFNEGIYKTFKEFKTNSPSLTRDVFITDERMVTIDSDFDTNRIYYKDSAGNRVKLTRDSIWGYSRNNVVYVNYGGHFHRLMIIGAIGHFIITQKINYSYQGTAYDDSYNKNYQFMLDFLTGKIFKYDLENFKFLLSSDKKLYYEFCALKRERKMKKQMFIYLRKYNKLHPIFLRVNSNGKSELTVE